MKDKLLHRGCDAGSDQGLERSSQVHRADQFPDCVLALRSVRKKDFSVLESEFTGRRFFTSFTAGVF